MATGLANGLEALFELERYLADAQGSGVGLPELERESVRRGRETVRLALQAHLDARSPGDVGKALLIEGDEGPVRLGERRLHTSRIVTLVGEFAVNRLGCAAPGHSVHPLDAELCLPARSFSYEVQAASSSLSVRLPV